MFPISDHVISSGGFAFFPSLKISFIYTRLLENLKARIRVSSHGLKWGNKPTKLNCSITDVFQQGNLVLFGCHKRYVKLGLYTNIGIFFEILRNVLSQSICVFRRDYLNSESQDKKKVPFDMTGWKTASPKVLCHILFAFVFVSPSDCFNTFPVELLTILSFSLFTFFRIYRSN